MKNGIMNYLIKFIIPFFLFANHNGYSQEKNSCDSIYASSVVDELADFGVSQKEFHTFLNTKIIPLISNEMNETKTIIPKLNMLFTISDKGELIKVEFPGLNASKSLHEKLANEFITLGKWKPALIKRKPVCSEFASTIGCMKWQ